MHIKDPYEVEQIEQVKQTFQNIIKAHNYTESHYRNTFSVRLLADAKLFVDNKEKFNIVALMDNKAQMAFMTDERVYNLVDPNNKENYILTGVLGKMVDVTLINYKQDILKDNFIALMNLITNKTHVIYLR